MASTPVFDVFDAFLARVNADDWVLPEEIGLGPQKGLDPILKYGKISFQISTRKT